MNKEKNITKKRIMVLDTSAFVGGFDPFSILEEQITPPLVEKEVKKDTMRTFRFNTAVETGKIKIIEPTIESINEVKSSATLAGDSFFLSDTDIQVLALALEIKKRDADPQIVTDDYSIQNIAKKLDIKFVSMITFGIRRFLNWMRYCPACHKKYPANYKGKECEICGTELKRKPQRPKIH
ncbi:MAG: ribonuclease VapC [Crenarchaeota archaeon]|nr:ribonuclease VapC [Thermoproteota archaeon]